MPLPVGGLTPAMRIVASWKMRNVAICGLLLAVVVALYSPVLNHPFVHYDDDDYVTENVHIRDGVSWRTVEWAFVSAEHANWHPLTWISHALDVEFYGLQPAGHHFTSVALHGLNAVMLFLLAFYGTRRTGPSLVLALLFAVHPIQVESVAWIAERKNVLSTFFFLLTLGAYGWYARNPHWGRYALVVIFLACGLMSKPMLVTVPFVLLLLDWWPLERIGQVGFSRLLLEKTPLLALAVVSAVITFRVQEAGHALRSGFPLVVRLENAVVAYGEYLWKLLWPARLAVFYPHPGAAVGVWKVVAASVVLAGITILVLVFRQQKYLLAGWLWFLGMLVPVIGVVQVGDQAMADRYAYVPFMGLFLMVTWASANLLQSQNVSWKIGAALACGVLLALALITHRQIQCWSSDEELWSHALEVTENNSLAHRKLGWDLMDSGKSAEALPHLREAAAIAPIDPTNHINLGLCLDANQQRNAAIDEFRKAISLTSDPEQLASAYTDLGVDYDGTDSDAEAHASYDRALQLNPKLFNAYFDRGLLFEKEGRVEDAVTDYQKSVTLQPTVQGYLQLTRALQKLNRMAEAQSYYEKARQLASDSEGTH
jgi:tetratricopeptide (TPR) repeat protein